MQPTRLCQDSDMCVDTGYVATGWRVLEGKPRRQPTPLHLPSAHSQVVHTYTTNGPMIYMLTAYAQQGTAKAGL
jgi:hypothetical protein